MKDKTLLYVNGDSWTYGEELYGRNDTLVNENEQSYKFYNSWPWKIKEHYNIPQLINDARGAGSNARIFRRTIEFIQDYQYDLSKVVIVVAWTSVERTEWGHGIEIADEDGVNKVTWYEAQYWPWTVGVKHNNGEPIIEQAVKHIAKGWPLLKHPSVDMVTLKNHMWGLQEICKANNIELHQFFALHCREFTSTGNDCDSALTKQINYHKPAFMSILNADPQRDQLFVERGKHPNKRGHKHIAEFIIKHIGDENENT